jgi:FkbM family methyltransferase
MVAREIKNAIHRMLRGLGWELQRAQNANVEHRVATDVIAFAGVSTVLDVGANVGQYGELLFQTGFAGTLISFEALPDAHRKLQLNADKQPRWKVARRAALGSNKGQIEINIAANSVSSSVLPMKDTHLNAAPESQYVGRHLVDVERLDELALSLLPPTGRLMIKIDTQGYEMEVLKGSTGLLPRTSAIQLELSLVPLYDGAPTFVEMISFLQSHGYELFSLVPGFKDARTGKLLQMDGFFVRSGGPV